MRTPPLKVRRWSRAEYDRLIARGVLDTDDRIELLDGLMVVKEPQGSWHAGVVAHITSVLQRAFGERYSVRAHSPIALDDRSEPEPDLAVVTGRAKDYLRAHPASPVLVVEVADSSLAKDRLRKGGLYARGEPPLRLEVRKRAPPEEERRRLAARRARRAHPRR